MLRPDRSTLHITHFTLYIHTLFASCHGRRGCTTRALCSRSRAIRSRSMLFSILALRLSARIFCLALETKGLGPLAFAGPL